MRRAALFLIGILIAPACAPAQGGRSSRAISSEISPDSLRNALFALAHDSMGGRQTGELGDWKAQEWIAAQFQRFGLRPAGDNGTYFQTIPFRRVFIDTASHIASLKLGRDFLPVGGMPSVALDGVTAVFGGALDRPPEWLDTAAAKGHLVVFAVPDTLRNLRQIFPAVAPLRQAPVARAATAIVLVALERVAPDLIPQFLAGRVTTDTTSPPSGGLPPLFLVSPAAARILLGTDVITAKRGTIGPRLNGAVRTAREPLAYASRNVIAVLPGRDPALNGQYVSISAHHDHVGFAGRPVDHDSTFSFNRVVRPMGADSPMRPPTAGESAQVQAMRDSLRALRPPRPDSIFNGADDDGSGTVALLEVARTLAAGEPLRRSVLFVSHAAEERGLLGSAWFTDHPTVPIDSIVGEIDMDMIGRGGAKDLPAGGPAYLEVIGARRLSKEYGDLLEQINAQLPLPFAFNYEYDAPGHPLQYYCRADHYSYARYGIPSIAVSRGEHADYHQVTDEPAYIDYVTLARVATLARNFVTALANRDKAPALEAPRPTNPHVPCRQ